MVIIKEFFPSKPQLISEYIENRRKELREGNKYNVKLIYTTKNESDDLIKNLLKDEQNKINECAPDKDSGNIVTPQITEIEEPQKKRINMYIEDAERHIDNALAFNKRSNVIRDEIAKLNVCPIIIRRITASKKVPNSLKNPDIYFQEDQVCSKETNIEHKKLNKNSPDANTSIDGNIDDSNELITNFNLNLSQLKNNNMKKLKRNLLKKNKIVSKYNEKVINMSPKAISQSASKTTLSRPPNNTPTHALSSNDFNKCGRIQRLSSPKSPLSKLKKCAKYKIKFGDDFNETKNEINPIKFSTTTPPKSLLVAKKQIKTFETKKIMPKTEPSKVVDQSNKNNIKTDSKPVVPKNSLKIPQKQLNPIQKTKLSFDDMKDKQYEITLPVVTLQMS